MTVTSQTARSGPYNGNGSSTSFSYTFRVDLEGELVVILADDSGSETTQSLTTHYTVTGVGNAAGGTVEMVTAPASGETLVVLRSVTKQQTIDLQNRKAVIPQVLEDGLDEVTRIVQDMSETLDRVPVFSPTYGVTSIEFPQASAGSAIGWNATADGLANLSSLPTAGITASTDNAVMRYDASTGGMQDSGVTINDAGAMNFANGWEISGAAVTPTAAELNYVSGVTSAIQTQLDNMLTLPVTLTGAASNWAFTLSGNNLVISYGGTNLFQLTTGGNLTVIGNVTAYGTI